MSSKRALFTGKPTKLTRTAERSFGRLPKGNFNKAVRVVAFNIAEGWSRDVTEDVANEIIDRALRQAEQLSRPAQEFVERVLKQNVSAHISAGY